MDLLGVGLTILGLSAPVTAAIIKFMPASKLQDSGLERRLEKMEKNIDILHERIDSMNSTIANVAASVAWIKGRLEDGHTLQRGERP